MTSGNNLLTIATRLKSLTTARCSDEVRASFASCRAARCRLERMMSTHLRHRVFPRWHGTKSLAVRYLNFTHFNMVIFSMSSCGIRIVGLFSVPQVPGLPPSKGYGNGGTPTHNITVTRPRLVWHRVRLNHGHCVFFG